MSLIRQGKWFVLIGGLQWVLDWLLTVALSYAGVPLEIANICGRVTGALLGFGLNGRITFANQQALGHRPLFRFILCWLGLTALSTWAMSLLGQQFSLQTAWLIKPLLEAALAVVSFFVSRHWIYR